VFTTARLRPDDAGVLGNRHLPVVEEAIRHPDAEGRLDDTLTRAAHRDPHLALSSLRFGLP
jgi:hypothetical protein